MLTGITCFSTSSGRYSLSMFRARWCMDRYFHIWPCLLVLFQPSDLKTDKQLHVSIRTILHYIPYYRAKSKQKTRTTLKMISLSIDLWKGWTPLPVAGNSFTSNKTLSIWSGHVVCLWHWNLSSHKFFTFSWYFGQSSMNALSLNSLYCDA